MIKYDNWEYYDDLTVDFGGRTPEIVTDRYI